FVLDVRKAMEDGAPQLHENYPNNILAHTSIRNGDYEKAVKEPGLTKVEGWYETPTVPHCHIENPVCYAYMEQTGFSIWQCWTVGVSYHPSTFVSPASF